MRDPYEVLGVARSASDADIKRAYRKLAKQYHPDRHAGDKSAQAKFAEINAANEILGDKEKRGKFDRGEIDAEGKPRFQGFEGFRGGQAGGGFENIDPSVFEDIVAGLSRGGGGTRSFRFSTGPGGRTFQSGGDEDDILRSVFGGFGARARARPAAPGVDVRADVAVTLEDIAGERRPKVTLPTGKTLALTLPKGVSDGQIIRLRGEGQASASGGTSGDALVTVRIVPHPLFKPEGSDLRLDLPVSLEEAVLGAKIAVPTLSGKVQVTVPPNSSSGRVLRLKGKGLPKAVGAGDLLVTPRIVLQDGGDADLETLMRRRREEGRPSPRGPAFD